MPDQEKRHKLEAFVTWVLPMWAKQQSVYFKKEIYSTYYVLCPVLNNLTADHLINYFNNGKEYRNTITCHLFTTYWLTYFTFPPTSSSKVSIANMMWLIWWIQKTKKDKGFYFIPRCGLCGAFPWWL